MAIVVTCSGCSTRLTVGDDRAGDRFECPQCDATIKVPGSAQPPARTPAAAAPADATAAAPSSKPKRTRRDPDPEPEKGTDKRVLGGIIAGGVGLLVVAVAIGLFAFRKPADNAKKDPDPATPGTSASSGTPGTSLFGGPGGNSGADGLFGGNTGGGSGGGTSTSGNSGGGSGGNATGGGTTGGPQPGMPGGAAGGQQFSAQFLGSQAKGRRFCIIADNSGSMRRNIPDLRAQLLKTIGELNAESEFYVIAFNTAAEPMPHHTWVKVGSPDTDRMKAWVNRIESRGGTNPVPAFEVAFRLNPPPDVIFFMTDGIFANTAPARIVELNGTPRKTVVNTIMFANAPPPKAGVVPPKMPINSEDQLKLIATQNGGTFTRFVP